MAGNGYDKFFKDAKQASKGAKAIRSRVATSSSLDGAATPEDHLRAELARRIKSKRAATMRKRNAFPTFAAVFAVMAFVACGALYYHYDAIDELIAEVDISRIRIAAFGMASASNANDGTGSGSVRSKGEKTAAGAQGSGENPAGTTVAARELSPAEIRQWSPEELSFFGKLSERKRELDQRESELNKLEEELQKRKTELDDRIKRLETMRTQISEALQTRVESDQEKVEKLAQFYSNMRPQQAAKVIESLNEDLAVEVLDAMRQKNVAEIMNMMDAKKARHLSELLTGYQRTPATTTGSNGGSPAEQIRE